MYLFFLVDCLKNYNQISCFLKIGDENDFDLL
jgi:hypothetical protein